MEAPDTPEYRAELRRLVELAGLIVWSDATNGCGIRYNAPRQKKKLDEEDSLPVFRLAQYIQKAGEWAEGIATSRDARRDATDLPGLAFHVATGMSEPIRQVLGEIIAQEAMLYLWNENSDAAALQVFDTWAQEVRALSFRLAVGTMSRNQGDTSKPWEEHT